MPMFYNNPDDSTKFLVVYDNRTDILNLHAKLFYRVNNYINFGLYGDYFHYEIGRDTITKPWHLPRFKVNFTGQYMIKEKATITFELFGRDAVYARNPNQNQVPGEPKDIKLKGTTDVNIGAIYKYSKYFSFFCNLNNLAHIKHEEYYLYPSYGFNMIAGAIFTY